MRRVQKARLNPQTADAPVRGEQRPDSTKIPRGVGIVIFLLLANLTAFALGTIRRNAAWHTEESLWRDSLIQAPKNGRGWLNYGLTQMSQGRMDEALAAFYHGRTLAPNYWAIEVNLGVAHAFLGDQETAARHFNRAVELAPDNPQVWYFRGRWRKERGEIAAARQDVSRAVALSAGYIEAIELAKQLEGAK